jgi:hypothetical protein
LALKDDQIVELLEHYGVDVIYDFDRLRENTPDRYSASFHDGAFEFIFNEAQLLRTIFLYASFRGKFKPINPGIAGIPLYQSFKEAKGAFERTGVPGPSLAIRRRLCQRQLWESHSSLRVQI